MRHGLALLFCLSFLLAACQSEPQGLRADKTPPPEISHLALQVASLHAVVTKRNPGPAEPLVFVSALSGKDGNWWFIYGQKGSGGGIIPDSGITVEIDPATQKLRVTNMAFSIHSKGAKLVTTGSHEFVTLQGLSDIWHGR